MISRRAAIRFILLVMTCCTIILLNRGSRERLKFFTLTGGDEHPTNRRRPSNGWKTFVHFDPPSPHYIRRSRDTKRNEPQFLPMGPTTEPDIRYSMNQSSKVGSYKTLLDLAYDWKNFWLYFRSTAEQAKIKTIDDAYGINIVRLANLMDESAKERKHVLDDLAQTIRKRIDKLQNPPDCDQAIKQVLDISDTTYGMCCTLHHVVYGLLDAFVANHTFVLHSKGWKYSPEGFEYAFLPLGRCDAPRKKSPRNAKDKERTKYLNFDNLPDWQKWAKVPEELERLLTNIHGDPYAWWIAQFVEYVFRLQPSMQKRFDDFGQEIGFSDSAVGVHIRWGDKLIWESLKHEVEEYMILAESWFQQQENRGRPIERVVYVASEQKEAWDDLKQKYPKYKFIGNIPSIVITKQEQRLNIEGLEGVLRDIYFLSKSGYVVAAMSSSVARTVYELRMNMYDDATTRFHSVDTLYKVLRHRDPLWEAIMDHEPTDPKEIAFKKGDQFEISTAVKLQPSSGYFFGQNLKTKAKGKVPIFKVRMKILTYDDAQFPKSWLLSPDRS